MPRSKETALADCSFLKTFLRALLALLEPERPGKSGLTRLPARCASGQCPNFVHLHTDLVHPQRGQYHLRKQVGQKLYSLIDNQPHPLTEVVLTSC